MKTRITAIILAILLCLSTFPAAVFAEDPAPAESRYVAVSVAGSAFTVGSSAKQYGHYYNTHEIGSELTVTYKGSGNFRHWKDENGILYIGVEQFLLDESAIDI